MQRGATRPLPRREVGRKGGPLGRFFVEHHMQNQKLTAKTSLPQPESDLGFLARVRLNLFSTVPHRRFSCAMNDRQKTSQPETFRSRRRQKQAPTANQDKPL